jgi:hypothetical protein
MQRMYICILSLFALGAFAHEHERVIAQASDLEPWCKSETEARYIAKGITPYQWTASYHDDGNALYVDGKVRVHEDDVAVHCRIARGAREEYGTVEIDDSGL